MIEKERFLEGLARCDIFFEKEKISDESIVRNAIDFFASGFHETSTRRRTLLHTGSVVYDAVAVLLSALADMLVFYVRNEEFLANLKPGDRVINTQYGKRLRREVKEIIFGECIKLLENPRTNCIYIMPWSQTIYLEPNCGRGRKIGRVELRQARRAEARDVFFKYAFGMKPEDLPRTPKSYTIVVASYEYAYRIFRGLEIGVKNVAGNLFRIKLSDIAGGIYITSERNVSLGGPLSKDDSVLRFCSSLTLAKEKINEAGGDSVASLLVISNDALMAGDAAVFNRLSSMKRKNFVMTSIAVGSPAVDSAIQNVGKDGKLLSHTRHYLRKVVEVKESDLGIVGDEEKIVGDEEKIVGDEEKIVGDKKKIVGEIWSQVRSLVNKKIFSKPVEGFLALEQYGEWLAAVKAFKNVPLDWEEKSAFLDEAWGLFAFLKGSVFEMSDIDMRTDLVWRGRKLSPVVRIANLQEMSAKYPVDVRVFSDKIISIIQIAYNGLKIANKKQEILEHIISEYQGRRIAVIVPQDGFKILFEELGYHQRVQSFGSALTIATPNSFGRGSSEDSQSRYDVVISLGGVDGKRFSPFSCSQANEVYVLLYAVEAKRFVEREKDFIRKEKVLNNQSTYAEYTAAIENAQNSMFEDENRFEEELAMFLREFWGKEDRLLAEKYVRLSGANRNVDVVKIGTLDSGEKIFFTKFFRPYVLVEVGKLKELKEVELDEVTIGDTLLFMQNNDACKDIVDVMLADYIAVQSSRRRMDMEDMLAKTRRWRQLLRDFSSDRQLSAADIAERMKATGSTIHEVTVRNWMDEESHLVGPRYKSSFEHIAKLTGDEELREHIDDYFEACKIIRERRVKLLHELGAQIKGGMTPETLADKEDIGIAAKVKDMVKLCVLENLTNAPENLRMNTLYVNRPITSDTKAGV